jgi:hypothetical protein
MRYYLTLHLHSDTTFGRGEGVAGLVDVEIEHDAYGCPYIGGRSIKGLLVEEWANLRFALGETDDWDDIATVLFGKIGATGDGDAQMRIGAATLPPDLCAAIRKDALPPHQIIGSITTVRRQTAINTETGAPEEGSLRTMRVLLRETSLIATLDFDQTLKDKERTLGLLSACVLAVRRGGTGRNRGRGRLSMLLHATEPIDYRDATFTLACFEAFQKEVRR